MLDQLLRKYKDQRARHTHDSTCKGGGKIRITPGNFAAILIFDTNIVKIFH